MDNGQTPEQWYTVSSHLSLRLRLAKIGEIKGWFYNDNQRTNGPVNAHLISWPSKAQNIQNLENIANFAPSFPEICREAPNDFQIKNN